MNNKNEIKQSCTFSDKAESDLYTFCLENVHNLIIGNLSVEKIKKLRDIEYSFDYYIDCYLKEMEEYK